MTHEQRLVVTTEIDAREFAGMNAEQAAKHAINTVRAKADEECEKVGAKLRTDRPPAMRMTTGEHTLLGLTFVLVWSNWYVDMPESVRVEEVHAP